MVTLSEIPLCSFDRIIDYVVDDISRTAKLKGRQTPLNQILSANKAARSLAESEIFAAKTRDDVIPAQARYQRADSAINETETMVRKLAVSALLSELFWAVGYSNGSLTLIAPFEWSGQFDWGTYSLVFGERVYSQPWLVVRAKLEPQQTKFLLNEFELKERARNNHGTSAKHKGTGAPGRPSSVHLAKTEFHARAKRGELEDSAVAESRILEAWFRENHPEEQPVTAKTIENKIRRDYKKYIMEDSQTVTEETPKNKIMGTILGRFFGGLKSLTLSS